MNWDRLIQNVRISSTVLIIALEFTNLITFLAEGGARPAAVQHSRYTFQFATYGLAAAILLLDPGAVRRVFRKPIMAWSFAALLLFSWSMVVRSLNPPTSLSAYDFVRYFGLRVNALGFLLTCVVIFDDRRAVTIARQAIVTAVILGVILNLYDLAHPGIFGDIPGRAAGLYVDANCSGMALVFGAVLGLPTIRRQWARETFILCVFLGVAATFSREAMISLIILVIGALAAGLLSPVRMIAAGAVCLVLVAARSLPTRLADLPFLTADTRSRVALQWSDSSTIDRLHLAAQTLEEFEDAPIMGQGFGTALFWTDDQSHNAFLGLLADCGILGALVIPALVVSVRRREWEWYVFAGIFLLWSCFYHDVLVEFFALIILAIEADQGSTKEAISERFRFRGAAVPRVGKHSVQSSASCDPATIDSWRQNRVSDLYR